MQNQYLESIASQERSNDPGCRRINTDLKHTDHFYNRHGDHEEQGWNPRGSIGKLGLIKSYGTSHNKYNNAENDIRVAALPLTDKRPEEHQLKQR
ncbi:hypothetical protein D3C77_394810 [compost metagenome]